MLAQLARTLFLAVILATFSHSSSSSSAKPIVEVGFVLDTTGSMGPLMVDSYDDRRDALRPMSPAQRQAEIDKPMSERKSLNARMSERVKNRDAVPEQSSPLSRRASRDDTCLGTACLSGILDRAGQGGNRRPRVATNPRLGRWFHARR
jgi:hypothetical protein